MVFSSQFALSLELTKLIPMGASAAWKAAEGLLSLARDIQSSGSDIVIEADLAELFGRSRIEPQLASTFKSIIAQNSSSKLYEGISLESGPGPTTLRALKPEQAIYFSTVIQCSLLTFVLKKRQLASAIKGIFDKRAEEAPPNQFLRASPTEEGILGFLQVCEDQTADYNWSHLLLTVSTMLGFSDQDAFDPIPLAVLTGLISSLALVQHFPEEQMIQVEAPQGACLIVVWAYHILGLTVWVRNGTELGAKYNKYSCFGQGEAHIIIQTRVITDYRLVEPSFTLLSLALENSKEPLFTIRSDPDETKLESVFKLPARGYASRVFENSEDDGPFKLESVRNEISNITIAISLIVSNHLQMEMPGESEEVTIASFQAYAISTSKIWKAARLLFSHNFKEAVVNDYAAVYTQTSLGNNTKIPSTIEAWFRANHSSHFRNVRGFWREVLRTARTLSLVILAFAHVQDLDSCGDMLLDWNCHAIEGGKLGEFLCDWDGNKGLLVENFVWFDIIATLLNYEDMYVDDVALVSNRGWSIYLSTFQLRPPSEIEGTEIIIKKGTPYRNGMYRHAIIDGWDKGETQVSEWQLHTTSGETLELLCTNSVVIGRPIYGEHRDSFIVSLRMIHHDGDMACTRRAGYRELCSALWMLQRTGHCDHPFSKQVAIIQPPDVASLAGFDDREIPEFDERVLVCLTANQDYARWRALLALSRPREDVNVHVLLRDNKCCLQCALGKASLMKGKCILIL